MTASNRRYLSRMDVIKISDLFRQHCAKDGAYAVYAEGWSDDEIARVVGGTAVTTNVASLRVEVVGRLKPKPKANDFEEVFDMLSSDIARIEKTLARLVQWAGSRPKDPYRSE